MKLLPAVSLPSRSHRKVFLAGRLTDFNACGFFVAPVGDELAAGKRLDGLDFTGQGPERVLCEAQFLAKKVKDWSHRDRWPGLSADADFCFASERP